MVFTALDSALLEASAYTLMACFYQGQRACEVIHPTEIVSVVAMVPLPKCYLDPPETPQHRYSDRYFVVEKPGLDIALMAGRGEEEDDPELDELAQPE